MPLVAIEVLRNFQKTDPTIANSFYQSYLLAMTADVFYVLTDADHKSGFKMQAMLLSRLINLVEMGAVTEPLYERDKVTNPEMGNVLFMKEHLAGLLQSAFPHVQA